MRRAIRGYYRVILRFLLSRYGGLEKVECIGRKKPLVRGWRKKERKDGDGGEDDGGKEKENEMKSSSFNELWEQRKLLRYNRLVTYSRDFCYVMFPLL